MENGINYNEILGSVCTGLLKARENCICKVVNQTLKTNIDPEDFTKEMLRDFVLLDLLHLNKTVIQYGGIGLGEVVMMEFPRLGWEFIPYSN